jgi:hypothetical protein
MSDKHEIEFFLAINEDGDFEMDTDASDARDRLMENFGGVAIRTVKLTARVRLPVVEEVEIDIPDAAGTTEKTDLEAAE